MSLDCFVVLQRRTPRNDSRKLWCWVGEHGTAGSGLFQIISQCHIYRGRNIWFQWHRCGRTAECRSVSLRSCSERTFSTCFTNLDAVYHRLEITFYIFRRGEIATFGIQIIFGKRHFWIVVLAIAGKSRDGSGGWRWLWGELIRYLLLLVCGWSSWICG